MSSGEVHVLYSATPPTLTNGVQAPLQGDANGNLKVSTVGSGVGGSSLVEVVDPNGDPLDYTVSAPVVQQAASAAVTSVNSQATNVTLLAAAATTQHVSIVNTDANTLYIKLGATATTSDWSYEIQTDETWDMPYRYAEIIDGIWAADGSGAAKITQYTGV